MKKSILILLSLLLFACTAERRWEDVESEIVVEGWIEAGNSPVIMLTKTITPSSEFRTMEELQDHIIKWAKVTVSGPDTTVVLTGMADSGHFPPYIYTTGHLFGKAGGKYTLTVEYDNKTVTATTTVPEPEEITAIWAEKLPSSDSLYNVKLRLGNEAGAKKYYRVLYKIDGEGTDYLPCFPGTIEGESLQSGAEITVTRSRNLFSGDFSTQFVKGSTVRIKLCTIDGATWQFWKDFDDLTIIGSSPIFPTYTNPASNVRGGLGYFSGFGAVYGKAVIE